MVVVVNHKSKQKRSQVGGENRGSKLLVGSANTRLQAFTRIGGFLSSVEV